jgi:nitrate/TMAO reductase-like tetraheme cytochrome c subunit
MKLREILSNRYRRSVDWLRGLGLKRWQWIVLIAGVVFLFGFGGLKYSESPAFCNSCHIMEPYYEGWKTSKHNEVSCVACHYPPASARSIFGTNSRPWPQL